MTTMHEELSFFPLNYSWTGNMPDLHLISIRKYSLLYLCKTIVN